MPRTIPTTEQFIEMLGKFADQHLRTHWTLDTCAVPWGGTRYGTGFMEYVKFNQRTLKATANDWIRTAALGDEPPFYWLSIRSGHVSVMRLDPDDPDQVLACNISDLGLCSLEVAAHIGLDENGTYLDPETRRTTPNCRPAMHGQWLITPDGLRNFVQRAIQAHIEHTANALRERAEEAAAIDALHGHNLNLIRGLLHTAGLDTGSLHASAYKDQAVVMINLRNNAEIAQLGAALAHLGIIPITRTQATTRTPAEVTA